MINWEVHTLLCSSQFAASPFVTILGCFVSFPLSYFVSAYLSSDSRGWGLAEKRNASFLFNLVVCKTEDLLDCGCRA